jgi:hypothetical protein
MGGGAPWRSARVVSQKASNTSKKTMARNSLADALTSGLMQLMSKTY